VCSWGYWKVLDNVKWMGSSGVLGISDVCVCSKMAVQVLSGIAGS